MMTKQKLIPEEVLEMVTAESKIIISMPKWNRFDAAWRSLHNTVSTTGFPFDLRFNSIHWGFDVFGLCREIAFSFVWMKAYADYYKSKVKPGSEPSNVDFHVSYYADNCVSRIDSCRDKVALLVWSYYCPFNPEKKEEVLPYEEIVKRLRWPMKYSMSLKGVKPFLKQLDLLKGKDFQMIKNYRHLKIHRREPRIEIYGPEPHHDWPYYVPITDEQEIKMWKQKLAEQHKDTWFRQKIEKGCYQRGAIIDQRTLKGRLWGFDEIQQNINTCFVKLIEASTGCYKILKNRAPFKKFTKRPYAKFRGQY